MSVSVPTGTIEGHKSGPAALSRPGPDTEGMTSMQTENNPPRRRCGPTFTVEPCIYGRANPSGAMRYAARIIRGGKRFGGPWVPTVDEARGHLMVLRERAETYAQQRRERRVRGRRPEVIYLIQAVDSGHIKVGRAAVDVVARRVENLQIAAWEELRLLGTVPGDSQVEREIHRRLARLHVRGEWFQDAPELRAVLDEPRWLRSRKRIVVA